MSDLSFLDKLDQEQLQNADKIITKAQGMGIDPRLALSLAYTESQLRQNDKNGIVKGSAGEIGIMQIKPTTAKLVGYDDKQILDADANIDAGLTYLKQNIQRYKNDPVLGTLAYNIGPDHPVFSGKGEAPEQGLSYVNRIESLGGFMPTPKPEAQATPEITPASEEDYKTQKAAALGALGGGALGTTVKGAQFLGAGAQNIAAKAGSPVEKWAQAMGYQQRGAETFAKAHEAEQGIRKGATIRNPATGQTFKPTFNVAKPPVIETIPTMGQGIKSGLQALGGAMARSPITTGVLAGAGALGGAQEAQTRYGAGDKLGAGIAGAGALGSAASMIPTLPTRIIGSGMAMASPAALALLDRMRQTNPQQVQRAMTNVDPMGNPLP